MNKWFSWNVFDGDISKLERIIQIAVEELEKQKDNNRIEKFYFIRQYGSDKHVTFEIKSSEERSSEVFEEVKLTLQQALNRDFTEREGRSENKENPSQIQELKAIATECALLSKDGVSLISSLACFSHFLLNASDVKILIGHNLQVDNYKLFGVLIDKQWLDNESKKLIELKGDNEDLFNKIEGYLIELKRFNDIFIEIIKNVDGLEQESGR